LHLSSFEPENRLPARFRPGDLPPPFFAGKTRFGWIPLRERRFTYAEYGELLSMSARGLAAPVWQPGEIVAILLAEFRGFRGHLPAGTLSGGFPTRPEPAVFVTGDQFS